QAGGRGQAMHFARVVLTMSVVAGLAPTWAPFARANRTSDARAEGLRLYKEGRYREALPYLDQVIERHPRDIELRDKRGGIYLRLGQPAQAVSDFDVAIRLSPFYPSP